MPQQSDRRFQAMMEKLEGVGGGEPLLEKAGPMSSPDPSLQSGVQPPEKDDIAFPGQLRVSLPSQVRQLTRQG